MDGVVLSLCAGSGWFSRAPGLAGTTRGSVQEINMHSFKNRFLLRIKNMDAGTYLRYFLPITLRDLGALGYVLACEQSSLRAVPMIFHALPSALKVRKTLRNHRRASPHAVRSWFSNRPISRPVQLPKF